MIPIDVDALLAKIHETSPSAGVTRVTRVTSSGIPSNHAGQEPLTAVTHAAPWQGNMGNTPETGAHDADAVTHVTQSPPTLGNTPRASQTIDTAKVSAAVTLVTHVTQKKGYVAHVLETPV